MTRAERAAILRLFRSPELPFADDLEAVGIIDETVQAEKITSEHLDAFMQNKGIADGARMLLQAKIVALMYKVDERDKVSTVQSALRKHTLAGARVFYVDNNISETNKNYRAFIYELPSQGLEQFYGDLRQALGRSTCVKTKQALNYVEMQNVTAATDTVTGLVGEVVRSTTNVMLNGAEEADAAEYARANRDNRTRLIENGGIELNRAGPYHGLLCEKLKFLSGHNPELAGKFNETIRFNILLAEGLDDATRARKVRYALFKLAIALRRLPGGKGKDAANDIFNTVFAGKGVVNENFSLQQNYAEATGHIRQLYTTDGRELPQQIIDYTQAPEVGVPVRDVVRAKRIADVEFLTRNPDQLEARKRLERRIQKIRRAFDLHDVSQAFADDHELDNVLPPLHDFTLFGEFKKHYNKLATRVGNPNAPKKPIKATAASAMQEREQELLKMRHDIEALGIQAEHEIKEMANDKTSESAAVKAILRTVGDLARRFYNTRLSADPTAFDDELNMTRQAKEIIDARQTKDNIEQRFKNRHRPA